MLRGFANTIKHHKETPFLLLKQKDTPAVVNGVITKYLVGYHGEGMKYSRFFDDGSTAHRQ